LKVAVVSGAVASAMRICRHAWKNPPGERVSASLRGVEGWRQDAAAAQQQGGRLKHFIMKLGTVYFLPARPSLHEDLFRRRPYSKTLRHGGIITDGGRS